MLNWNCYCFLICWFSFLVTDSNTWWITLCSAKTAVTLLFPSKQLPSIYHNATRQDFLVLVCFFYAAFAVRVNNGNSKWIQVKNTVAPHPQYTNTLNYLVVICKNNYLLVGQNSIAFLFCRCYVCSFWCCCGCCFWWLCTVVVITLHDKVIYLRFCSEMKFPI